MINFLINRPIAVTMSFLSILVLGLVSLNYIPVSLLPDIDIPEVSVQVSSKNTSARELESTVIRPLRKQLLQTSHLSDIKSETRDEQGIIHLRFAYGTDIDYAFVEVNEKIDRAMNSLPREIERPKAIKASATDIPVFYLTLTLKDSLPDGNSEYRKQKNSGSATSAKGDLYPVSSKFVELSNFAEQVIRKRIEQLPQVSFVDMSGMVYSELLIIPDPEKIRALNISLSDIEKSIQNSNVRLGNLLIRDGQYQYNVQVNSEVNDIRDLENIYINKEGRLFKLSELAEIIEHPQKRAGMVTSGSQDALTMAIIKQGDVQMGDLKKRLNNLVWTLKKEYPNIRFEITRDQTQLLDYAIVNLGQSLIWGVVLAFLVMFFFLKDFRSPVLIGISVPVSLIVTLLFFHVAGVTINIISLSGLILGVGMMVDNSIIVIDNITQYRERGLPLNGACIKATNEVFRPLLSSVLTTCAVFIPLIFLSGISGALFFDQAVAVSIGLITSLVVSITLIPVYYRIFYKRGKESWLDRKLKRLNTLNYEGVYEKGFRWMMRHQKMSWFIFLMILTSGLMLFYELPKKRMPEISRSDFIVKIDWNERINVDENYKRTDKLLNNFNKEIYQDLCLIGSQQFLLKTEDLSASEVSIYIKIKSSKDLESLKSGMANYLKKAYPLATFSFDWADNIFDLIFGEEEAPLVARLQAKEEFGKRSNEHLKNIHSKLQKSLPEVHLPPVSWKEHLVLSVDPLKIKIYQIPLNNIITALQSAFNEKEVLLITSGQNFVPVIVGGESKSIDDIISQTFVTSQDGIQYPLREIISRKKEFDLKMIVSGPDGEYYPINLDVDEDTAPKIMGTIKDLLSDDNWFRAEFTGGIFNNKELIYELSGVLIISLLLLYFILASQFESLKIPIIVLLEVPLDIFGAFLFLKFFGAGINLMSMIGIVVMSGIIINDSILKIDTINQLIKKEKMPLLKSMLVAGQRRLKPILMTSLTTILALLPILFSKGLGADLQKPLALAVIGGMIIGTLVSLYFVPLCYYYLERRKHVKQSIQ